MKITRRRALHGSAALAAAALISHRGEAQTWRPTQNVRVIVPAAPGGITDTMGRLLAAFLQTSWGQTVIVENKGGGGGTIATLDFVRQPADGHAILNGTSGTGQTPHLTAAWLSQLTGIKMTHLPFRGAGSALAGALGGEPPILFDNLFPSLPQVLDGKLKGLAVTTLERNPLAPNVPTVAESVPAVLGTFEFSSWICAMVPAGTPEPIVQSINQQCKAFLETDEAKKRFAVIGARGDYQTTAAFKTFVRAEIEKFAGIIKREGLQMDVN